MAKFLINTRVGVWGRNDNKYGRIVDITGYENDGHHVTQYVVLMDDTKELEHFEKRDLIPVPKPNTDVKTVYPKMFVHVADAKDGRKIVVVGVVDTEKVTVCSKEPAEYYEGYRLKQVEVDLKRTHKFKELRIGYSICHPDDVNDYSEEFGVHLAKKRCWSRPMSILQSPYLGEFREDLVTAILKAKADYIVSSIENGDAKFLKA